MCTTIRPSTMTITGGSSRWRPPPDSEGPSTHVGLTSLQTRNAGGRQGTTTRSALSLVAAYCRDVHLARRSPLGGRQPRVRGGETETHPLVRRARDLKGLPGRHDRHGDDTRAAPRGRARPCARGELAARL